MTFRIHASPDGVDDVLWESTVPVEVADGLFAVELGRIEPLAPELFEGELRYLAIRVGDPPEELRPRQALGGAPYALVAGSATALAPAAVQQVSRAVGTRLAEDPELADVRDALVGPPGANCWDATGDVDGDGVLTPADCAPPRSLAEVSGGALTSQVAGTESGAAPVMLPAGSVEVLTLAADVPYGGRLDRLDVRIAVDHAGDVPFSIELETPGAERLSLHEWRDPAQDPLVVTYSTQGGPGAAALAPALGRDPAGRWTLHVDFLGRGGTVQSFALDYWVTTPEDLHARGRLYLDGEDVAASLAALRAELAVAQERIRALESRPYVRIEPGEFWMGSRPDEEGRDDDETRHRVRLTRPYLMKKTEVTQAEWAALMGNNPSFYGGCPDCPVERVNWYDAASRLPARASSPGRSPTPRAPAIASSSAARSRATTAQSILIYSGDSLLATIADVGRPYVGLSAWTDPDMVAPGCANGVGGWVLEANPHEQPAGRFSHVRRHLICAP